MLEHGITVFEQSMTGKPKWSFDKQYSTLALSGLNGLLERPDVIDQLLMSSPDTYMIVLTIFFELLLWQTSTHPRVIVVVLKGGDLRSTALR